MSVKSPVSEASFEAKYRHSPDPWQFAASPYEQRRYAAILRSLSRARYSRAFEPGCSVGVLTAALAGSGNDTRGAVHNPLRSPRRRFLATRRAPRAG
jgi:Nodulation protein S (NodS)